MSKQFVKGNIYVFTKKNYMKDRCKDNSKAYVKFQNSHWVDSINGNIVVIENNLWGSISEFGVHAKWCRCIKNNNPKFKEEN